MSIPKELRCKYPTFKGSKFKVRVKDQAGAQVNGVYYRTGDILILEDVKPGRGFEILQTIVGEQQEVKPSNQNKSSPKKEVSVTEVP